MGFCITYNSRDGRCIFLAKDGEVKFNKDDMGLTYIDAKKGRDLLKNRPG